MDVGTQLITVQRGLKAGSRFSVDRLTVGETGCIAAAAGCQASPPEADMGIGQPSDSMSLDCFRNRGVGFCRLAGALPQCAEGVGIGALPRQTSREPLRAVLRLKYLLLHYFRCKNVTFRD